MGGKITHAPVLLLSTSNETTGYVVSTVTGPLKFRITC